jgi:Glycosyl transferases group 1
MREGARTSKHLFKNTIVAISKLRVQTGNLRRSIWTDLLQHLINPLAKKLRPTGVTDFVKKQIAPRGNATGKAPARAQTSRPWIFVSYATDETLKGSHRYCGGEKLLNNLVLLLRRHGYEAYMVSMDGAHSNWLVEHAPFLSLEEFARRAAGGQPIRCVTSWVLAQAFLQHCPGFYFWDQELATSSRSQFPTLARQMRQGRIRATAGLNRSIQAWHMAIFERRASLLRTLVDDKHWKPDEVQRKQDRVGYMDEGSLTATFVDTIRSLTRSRGLELEFIRLAGVEADIIKGMQTCSVFLALNVGKSPLWGEGGPMTPHEAMACGAIPICFDMNGPWELIQHGYNGFVLPEIRPELMANQLISIYSDPGRLEVLHDNTLAVFRTSHCMESRWPFVCEFLRLPQET